MIEYLSIINRERKGDYIDEFMEFSDIQYDNLESSKNKCSGCNCSPKCGPCRKCGGKCSSSKVKKK